MSSYMFKPTSLCSLKKLFNQGFSSAPRDHIREIDQENSLKDMMPLHLRLQTLQLQWIFCSLHIFQLQRIHKCLLLNVSCVRMMNLYCTCLKTALYSLVDMKKWNVVSSLDSICQKHKWESEKWNMVCSINIYYLSTTYKWVVQHVDLHTKFLLYYYFYVDI